MYQRTYDCYGVRIGVRATTGAPAAALCARFDLIAQPVPGNATRWYEFREEGTMIRLCIDGVEVNRSHDAEDMVNLAEGDAHEYIPRHAQDWVFLHAGVVARHGQALLLPGDSMDGKSTLVHALVKGGATYYSDECAVLDRSGRVHPFPRALRLRSGQTHRRVLPAGAGRDLEAIPVGGVSLLTYVPGTSLSSIPVSGAVALLRLLPYAAPRDDPRLALDTLAKILRRARVRVGTRGEADEAVPRLLELLKERSDR